MIKNSFIFSLIFFLLNVHAQKKGCTDLQAANYDPTAIQNDGSCVYNTTNYIPQIICSKLSDSLKESSGLLNYNNWFWSQGDSGNEPTLYAFDSITGKIIHQTFIKNYANKDWEDITQDSLHFYIGDFGNNDGNRTDLLILIVNKADLKLNQKRDSLDAALIKFSFADQTSFVTRSQNHNFDMEAMSFYKDSLHLFSKNWVDNNTRHYILPAIAGTYSLSPLETLVVDGQVTGACINAKQDKIILTGYNKSTGVCFMHMLSKYHNGAVFNGNKRRIGLGNALSFGQNEAVCFKGNTLYFTNEEKFTSASLRRVEIGQWFTEKVKDTNGLNLLHIERNKFKVYQLKSNLIIEGEPSAIKQEVVLLNTEGKIVLSKIMDTPIEYLDIKLLSKGIYILRIGTFWQKVWIE